MMEPLYKRLDESEIRLLIVISHNVDTAELELLTYSRDEAPEYDAVSYTWGDEKSTTSVSCNGLPLLIRTNLFTALPYIHESRPGPRRPLWIDAICLNQKDDIEKSIHVPIMGSIYKKATRTLIWLGEAADDSDLALDRMGDLTQRMLDVDPAQAFLFLEQHKDLRLLGLPADHEAVWKSFQAIQLRPWYNRLWTLQEVVLANEVIMLCGNKTMAWDAMMMLQRAARRAQLISLVMPVEWDLSGMPGDLSTTITFAHGLRTQLSRQPAPMRLNTAIQFTVNRKYEEPIDRIWALLGLLDDRNREFCVKADLIKYGQAARLDYHETYLGIMRLYTDQNPVVGMALFEAGLSQIHNPKLPFWCPDWHLDRTSTPFSYMEGVAAGIPNPPLQGIPANTILPSGRLRPIISTDDKLIFHVSGLIVDAVLTNTNTTGIFWGSYLDWRKTLDIIRITQSCNWLRECLDIFEAANKPIASLQGIENTDRTPVTPSENIPNSVTQPFAKLQSYMEQLKGLLGFEDETLDHYSVRSWCEGRKFFRTRGGRFGLGPHDLTEGDLVCTLFAGAPLFVLRPIDSQGELKQRYQAVGDAYVPGLMQGEGLRGKQWDEMQEFSLV